MNKNTVITFIELANVLQKEHWCDRKETFNPSSSSINKEYQIPLKKPEDLRVNEEPTDFKDIFTMLPEVSAEIINLHTLSNTMDIIKKIRINLLEDFLHFTMKSFDKEYVLTKGYTEFYVEFDKNLTSTMIINKFNSYKHKALERYEWDLSNFESLASNEEKNLNEELNEFFKYFLSQKSTSVILDSLVDQIQKSNGFLFDAEKVVTLVSKITGKTETDSRDSILSSIHRKLNSKLDNSYMDKVISDLKAS